jgi:hypothetical protein
MRYAVVESRLPQRRVFVPRGLVRNWRYGRRISCAEPEDDIKNIELRAKTGVSHALLAH